MITNNDAGIKNARHGIWNGQKSVFTHRNPETGAVFGEDLAIRIGKKLEYGRWVPADEVEFVD